MYGSMPGNGEGIGSPPGVFGSPRAPPGGNRPSLTITRGGGEGQRSRRPALVWPPPRELHWGLPVVDRRWEGPGVTRPDGDHLPVVIGRTRHKMVQLEVQEAAKQGARLIEVRLDFLRKAPDFSRLLAQKP